MISLIFCIYFPNYLIILGHFERYPYSESEKRSVYHQREFEFFKLHHYSQANFSSTPNLFMSHDWPVNIVKYGDTNSLIRQKPFFQQDIQDNKLGSPPLQEILEVLKPNFWFSAHLHVKFPAIFPHPASENEPQSLTRFLALDKVLPRRYLLIFILYFIQYLRLFLEIIFNS